MASPVEITNFVARFNELLVHRDKNDELIKDLIIYNERVEGQLRLENTTLRQQLQEATLDLDDAKKSRRDLQTQLNLASKHVTLTNNTMDRNPYIQVLIDGDGMIFNAGLINLGVEGGKQAAAALRNAVLEHCSNLTDQIEVIANVYANQHGLTNAMLRDGSLEDMDHLNNFAVGFTQGKASFNFVDVGHGKERADSKIKELTRWHLRNHNCKQILLGISHDAGYAPFLDEVIKPEDRCKVTIMEGPKTVRELVATGIQMINFNQLFRPSKLTERVSSASAPNTWAGLASKSPPPLSSPTIAKNGLNVKRATPVLASAKPAWSPSPRGLDAPITVNAVVLEKIKRRTNSNKLCNNHYLRGPCAKGDECCFEHKYKATEEDMKAIAFLTRLNPCTSGQDCDLEFCIYGHHCPSVTFIGKEPVCNAFGCRFKKEDHPPGTVIKNPRKERWEHEYNY